MYYVKRIIQLDEAQRVVNMTVYFCFKNRVNWTWRECSLLHPPQCADYPRCIFHHDDLNCSGCNVELLADLHLSPYPQSVGFLYTLSRG